MKATWEKIEGNWYQFAVEVEPERFSLAVEEAYRQQVRTARIPGFRPGKAPRLIFEKFFGRDHLIEKAIENLLPVVYTEALQELSAVPIDQPEFKLELAEDGVPFRFSGKVQVKPEVTLGPLTGFEIETPELTIGPEDVDTQLRRLQDSRAQLVPDETGEVQNGSFVIIDYAGFNGEELIEGAKGEDITLEIGSGTMLPGFEEGLIGAKADETRELQLTFPENYRAEHLRNVAAVFRVTVKDVKKKELPELDDAFASTVGAYQTVQELREALTNRMVEAAKTEVERSFRDQIVAQVVAAAQVDVPELLIHRQIHYMLEEFEHSLYHQGLTWEAFSAATGKDFHTMHSELEAPALEKVKRNLVLEAVAEQTGLAVDEAEIDMEFYTMSGLGQDNLAEMQSHPENRARVKLGLLRQKAVEHLAALNRPASEPVGVTPPVEASEE